MYPGQGKVLSELTDFKECAITSHTGAGKSAVFIAATRGLPTLIIEPRKYLQLQIKSYCNDYVLFGKVEYPCKVEYPIPFGSAVSVKRTYSAATAPCNRRIPCDSAQSHTTCAKVHRNALRASECHDRPCQVFLAGTAYLPYPCEGCAYIQAVKDAIKVLKNNGTVICNFGNFWNLLDKAKVVVVDEADLFFKEISSPTRMFYSNAKEHAEDSLIQLLQREQQGLTKAIKTSDSKLTYSLQNKLYTVQFLLNQAELCFKYQKKDKIYIEVNPDNVSVLKDKLFKGKRLLIVSATLGNFNIPQYSYSVWQRRGVFYKPVGKMTSRNLKMQPSLMNHAAKMIEEISGFAEGLYDTKQFVIHAGNIGNFGESICNLLGKEDCTLHQRGNLMKTISDFLKDKKRYLVVAGADYGGSFDWCRVQYILKFPFATLDERMRVLEKVMGREKFNQFYMSDARTRFTQQVGRNCRGWGDFGCTIVLDAKFWEDWKINKLLYPDWLRSSFDEKVY
jgi:hypothetical protein